jgi:hypothetical protein
LLILSLDPLFFMLAVVLEAVGTQQPFNLLEVLVAEVAEARVLLQEIQIAINKVFQVLTVWVAVVVAMALVTQQ